MTEREGGILQRVVSLALPAALLVLHAAPFVHLRLDDVFVSLRYATNIVDGHGWVFNPGERVEGFTSPLFVAIEALLLRAHVNGLVGAKVLSLVGALLMMAGTLRLTRELGPGRAAPVLAGLLLAVATPAAVATSSGLEFTCFAAACVWGLALCQSIQDDERVHAGILLGLATVVRPEGILAFACAFFLSSGRLVGRTDLHWRWLYLALPWSLLGIPATIARANYYGAIASNVLVARIGPHNSNRWRSGYDYVSQVAVGPLLTAGVIALVILAGRSARARPILVFVIVWTAYVITTGGDRAPGGIVSLPALPFLCAALGTVTVEFVRAPRPSRIGVLVVFGALIVGSAIAGTRQALEGAHQISIESTDGRGPLGDWLRRTASPGDTVAVMEPGEIGLASGLRIIDLSGLTDRETAKVIHKSHGAYSYDYVSEPSVETARKVALSALAKRPEFIVVKVRSEGRLMLTDNPFVQDSEFARMDAFWTGYAFLCSRRITQSSPEYLLYARKDLHPRVEPTHDADGERRCE